MGVVPEDAVPRCSPSLASQSFPDDHSMASSESDAPDAVGQGSSFQPSLEDFSSYAQLIMCMAKTLQLDAQIPQQERDLVFQDMEQDKASPPSLSLIPALFKLVKTS